MTQINIISGFLGAGKTTLIKKLLEEVFKGEKIVLIENEFGEIGIDGGFLKNAGIQVNEMNSGCICCSLVGDFGEALKQVLETYEPDRILIEPSGVGKLSDVAKAVEGVSRHMDVCIDSAVTVVDAKKCRMYMKNFGEFFNNQIEHAGTIVLSRTQSVSGEKLAECVAMLKEHNENATLITTPWDQLQGEQILAAMKHAELDMHDIIMTTTRSAPVAVTTMTTMSITIIMTTTRSAPAAATTMSTSMNIIIMITTIIITQTKCLQAGVQRRCANIPKLRSQRF